MGPQLCGLMFFRQGLRERSPRLAAPAHAMKRLTIAIAMLIAAAVGAPMADASTRQLTVMQDDVQVRGATDRTLDEFDRLGIDIVKVNLYWDEVAPNRRRKPAGFDGADPADYSWSNYGDVINGII